MLAPPGPMSTQAVTAKLTTVWQCRGQTAFVPYTVTVKFTVFLYTCKTPCMFFIHVYKHIWSSRCLCVGSTSQGKLSTSFKQLWHLEGAPVVLQPFDSGCIWPESSGLAQSSGSGLALKERRGGEKAKGEWAWRLCCWSNSIFQWSRGFSSLVS